VLTLTKTADPVIYSELGQTIKYTFVIKNTGETALGPAQFSITDNRLGPSLNCGPLGTTLTKDATISCTFDYFITATDMGVASLTNSATASGGGAPASQAASVTVTNLSIVTATPSPTSSPPSDLVPGTTIQHRVVPGEWLIQIARCYGANFEEVRNANPQIVNPHMILPDMIVSVPHIGSVGRIYGRPCISSYTVQSGDTWESIAQKPEHNADVEVLRTRNAGALSVGRVLIIPRNSAGGLSVPLTPQPIPTCNRAQLVSDVSIPDGTTLAAGSTFTKTWQLKNTGTCTWTTAYVLIFDHGERMDAPATVPLTSGSIPPGATVDVSVNLKAPAAPGTYQADFRLRSPDNIVFGVGPNGQDTFWVKIVVSQLSGGLGKIAFSSERDGNREIYVMNADGSSQVRVTNNNATEDFPAWSSDSSKIVFTSNRDGNVEIYVMNADGNNQVRVTNNSVDDFSPVWSPDGSKIAFTSNRDGNREIYVMNADGNNQVRLTNNTLDDEFPVWSPDGSKLVFASNRDGNREIYVMNADGSSQVRVTNNNATDEFPVWSPDASKIVFTSNRDGNREIYVMNADGNNQVRVTNNSVDDFSPVWSSDGSKIAFTSNRDGNFEIYVMNADGNNQIRLTNNNVIDFSPAW
jgi:uncharacterized repeat protein (TIGR01451 family)